MSVKLPNQRTPEVVCPVMRGMVAEGHLKVDENGDAKISELKDIFEDLGFSRGLANAAALGNRPRDIIGNFFGGKFNVNELRGGLLDHSGDSMILRNGSFDAEKFETLVSHSADGKRMTMEDFEKAIVTNKKADNGSWLGAKISNVEFSILLKAFGKEGADGKAGIPIEDLRGLYQDKKIPDSFRPELQATAGNSVASLSAEVRGLPSDSKASLAKTGAASALKGKDMFDNGGIAAKGAGQGICPHMGAGVQQSTPANSAEVTQLHNQIEGAQNFGAEGA